MERVLKEKGRKQEGRWEGVRKPPPQESLPIEEKVLEKAVSLMMGKAQGTVSEEE
jgi:hypothetical protein